jgi:hypothetical protein
VTLLNTLPGSGASTDGTSRNGDRVHGTPTATPDAETPEVGWGFTHTRFSADVGGSEATERVRQQLEDVGGLPQNQHIMGWDADNPEPVKGRYDFEDLDRRIDFVRSSGSTPIVTLCCAPEMCAWCAWATFPPESAGCRASMARSALGTVRVVWCGLGHRCSPEAQGASGERVFRSLRHDLQELVG